MAHVLTFSPDIKRLRTFIDRTEGIQRYTKNNLYPQIVESVRDRSYTVGIACKRLAGFIRGDGFEDATLGAMKVNSKGQTLNSILRSISNDAATYSNSFVVHLGVNLLGQYNNISVWPLSHFRFGLPDGNGEAKDIKYCSNWEQDKYKEQGQRTILEYPVFNPDPEFIKEQIQMYGAENYPGQVYYVTMEDSVYPLATFDSVLDQAQTQEEIGIYRLAAIQNGLNAGTIFSYPGTFESDEKANQFKAGLQEYKGGAGANSIMVIEGTGGTKASDLVTPLTVQNHDKVHEFISKDNKDAIREVFSMPPEIIGEKPQSGLFNKQQMEEAYLYYNTITKQNRSDISDIFTKIFANWAAPVGTNFKIKPLAYGNV